MLSHSPAGKGATIASISAVSDIHGHLEALHAALDIVDLEGNPDASLVLLGDYVDRGRDSRGVLELVREVAQRHPDRVTVLLGNHDCGLLEWLDAGDPADTDDEDPTWILSDEGLTTVRSFVSESVIRTVVHDEIDAEVSMRLRREVLKQHAELFSWLRRRPRVHETEGQIFVHAGIDELAGEHWRGATPEHWLTEKYPASQGRFHKTIIAGHVRTAELHADGDNAVYHDGASHYYIDAAVEVTGQLNVLRYDVESDMYSWQMTPVPAARR